LPYQKLLSEKKNKMILSAENNAILKDFLSMSHWQTAVAVVAFYLVMIPFFILATKYKLKFMYRVLIGLGIGLIFGVVVQVILGFPEALTTGSGDNKTSLYPWLDQFNIWAQLMKQVFINGILLLTIPVVFVATFRVTARPGNKGMGRITGKIIFILLIGVLVAFTATFWIGYALKVGKGVDLDATSGTDPNADAHATQSIPELVWGYVSQNFIATLAGTTIIPVIIIAAIIGCSVQFINRKHPDAMNKLRFGLDRTWDILMSMLMTFMKIMPMAVMAMITTAVTSRPIGALATIGKVIGVGYIGIAVALVYMTIVLVISGIKTGAWWKIAWKPLLQGFATQSSNAALPMSMEEMQNSMKINERVVSISGPFSTSMGLIACAGVQSGLITSFLWTGSGHISSTFSGGLAVFFIMSLVICLVSSLGIAGIPGTATVVTSGVLGGLGFSSYFAPVYGVIGALDGLFDMGRTGANVLGGIFAATLTAKWEGLLDEDSPLLSAAGLTRQGEIRQIIEIRSKIKDEKNSHFNAVLKTKAAAQKEWSSIPASPERTNLINDKKQALKEQLEQMNVKHTETLAQYQTERSKLKTKIKTEKSKEAQA
jgi:L-cystine uptake protein TcyP (sodium:dicarboxylate symporter family)